MKIPIILFLLLSNMGNLFAQAPAITYLQVDEAKSQLWIVGTFGSNSGSVAIEDTTLDIDSWSDTMIVCNLPDSGKGAGGWVEVQTVGGVSNRRALSILKMQIHHTGWQYDNLTNGFINLYTAKWFVVLRSDLVPRKKNILNQFSFELSKASYGIISPDHDNIRYEARLPWRDSLTISDSSVSLTGRLNLDDFHISWGNALMQLNKNLYHYPLTISYHPLIIFFDTTGFMQGYLDTATNTVTKRTNKLFSGQILFPPSVKSSVHQSIPIPEIIVIMNIENNIITLKADRSFGSATTSLYTIDGRLLRRENIEMNVPGEYQFDVSGLTLKIGILVLRTDRGIIVKKILL